MNILRQNSTCTATLPAAMVQLLCGEASLRELGSRIIATTTFESFGIGFGHIFDNGFVPNLSEIISELDRIEDTAGIVHFRNDSDVVPKISDKLGYRLALGRGPNHLGDDHGELDDVAAHGMDSYVDFDGLLEQTSGPSGVWTWYYCQSCGAENVPLGGPVSLRGIRFGRAPSATYFVTQSGWTARLSDDSVKATYASCGASRKWGQVRPIDSGRRQRGLAAAKARLERLQ